MTENFLWGTASASFQNEGALTADGRGASIWDSFVVGRSKDGALGEPACDSYHKFDRDLEAMKFLGVNSYRFSLAWSRIFPNGTGAVNPLGVKYYHKVIDLLLENGITPLVTLYHWDLPQALQDRQGGWLSRQTSLDFEAYAKFCFKEFGDKVPFWCTLNEPWCSSMGGFMYGSFAPGHKNELEAYKAANNLIVAHGLAARTYHDMGLNGQIGMANNCDWREPLTDTPEDRAAALHSLESFYGTFADPGVFGDYPEIIKSTLGKRLPAFTKDESKMLENSIDFIGINHYTTLYASAKKAPVGDINATDKNLNIYLSVDPEWELSCVGYGMVPWGFRKVLNWLVDRYGKRPIYITENGYNMIEKDPENLDDEPRGRYLTQYINAMRQAIEEDHIPVKGYFCWTLEDNMEWTSGFEFRAGLFRCSPDDLRRRPKKSALVYRDIITKNIL